MATEISSTEQLVDSAIGPVKVKISVVQGYDIDDFVSDSVRAQATTIDIANRVADVDPVAAKGRPKVVSGDSSVGGY